LHKPSRRRSTGSSATSTAGTELGLTSPLVLGLFGLTLLAIAIFILVERRAGEPVLPLRLFSIRTFALSCIVGGIVGFALFGSVTYVPLFLQIVKGASPTSSGLQMVPMMGGMLVTSIASGQIISRTGRYRWFPIAGTIVITTGLGLLSTMSPTTHTSTAMLIMLVLGLGLGMVMQVLILVVQNAVKYADLGVATSGATMFRLIGGALGTAVLGSIFGARLAQELTNIPSAGVAPTALDPRAMAHLEPGLRAAYANAFTASLHTVFSLPQQLRSPERSSAGSFRRSPSKKRLRPPPQISAWKREKRSRCRRLTIQSPRCCAA
jgi:predicted MFS family arabinose efflux permease